MFILIAVVIVVIVLTVLLILNVINKRKKSMLKRITKQPNVNKLSFDKTKNLSEVEHGTLFYVTKKFSSKKGNYIHSIDKDRYSIVEPGYIYLLLNTDKLVVKKDVPVFYLDSSSLNKKIIFVE